MKDKLIALNRFFRERNMTTQDIAEKVAMTRQQVENLLRGKSSFRERVALSFSKHYGFSPSWLLTGEGEMLGSGDVNVSDKGERVNTALRLRGLNKLEAGKLAGISSGSMSNITSGKVNLSVNYACKLSSALGVSASWLLTGEGPMEVEGWVPPSETPRYPRPLPADGQRGEVARLRRENAELREEVARLREQTERLMSVVENLTKGNS